MLIDTHSHMYLPEFDADRGDCMARARTARVGLTALPNIDASTMEPLRKMRGEYPDQTIGMMGLHPCSVKADFESQLQTVEAELDRGGYHAVGEIGMDLYWDKTFQAQQAEAFGLQIDWAKDRGLPIAIHARDSFEEICDVLDRKHEEGLTGVFHCFGGSPEQARRALGYSGFVLGIGGVLTFKNSGLADTLQAVGTDRLVLETDAPYLAPHPYRGKRNETAYTALVADKLAETLGGTREEIAQLTTANAEKLFQLDISKPI